ncbi:hypothetical protein JTE90_024665 [Oedothorax gibbosus]|nr:hypothetical protein JTE90_024665 [Oedothorax gibbosus]
MVRYFLRISYIGTKYRGIQKQKGVPDDVFIQGAIEGALSTLNLLKHPHAHFSSRTDKGVHALMNTLHVDLEHPISDEVFLPHYVKQKLNNHLAKNEHDIIVTNACIVPDTFHARFCARKRSYYYRLAVLKPEISDATFQTCLQYLPVFEMNRCHIVPSELNTSIVKRVADIYRGEHDFSGFTKYLKKDPWRNPIKIIEECDFYELPCYKSIGDPQYSNISMWEFYVKSKAFLYHQVRKMVGVAIAAGLGHISLTKVESMLEDPNPNKFSRCHLPPPWGLYLANIEYDRKG